MLPLWWNSHCPVVLARLIHKIIRDLGFGTGVLEYGEWQHRLDHSVNPILCVERRICVRSGLRATD